jgi:hypothetical protein
VTGNRVQSHQIREKPGCAGFFGLIKRNPGFGRGFSHLPMLTDRFHQCRTVTWQMSIPRSNSRGFDVPNEQRETDYIITTRRIRLAQSPRHQRARKLMHLGLIAPRLQRRIISAGEGVDTAHLADLASLPLAWADQNTLFGRRTEA